MENILITGPFDDEIIADLEGRGFDVSHASGNLSEEELAEALGDADAYVLGGSELLTGAVAERAKRLKIVVFPGVQPETYLSDGAKEALERRGIRMEVAPGGSTNAVAELACALILGTLRRVPFLTREVQDRFWPYATGRELHGKVLGVYGMGKIGYTLVERLSGFDLKVLYYDVVQAGEAERNFGVERVELPRLFAESDAVSIHASLTPETEGSVGEELLSSMKPDAVLVNTARPGIVQPNALHKALEGGWLAAAAFDGYYVEGWNFMQMGESDPYGLLGMRTGSSSRATRASTPRRPCGC
ncbi:MAG: NAD(P)-dependent oxidoreductase [Armatimonadota bacterium]